MNRCKFAMVRLTIPVLVLILLIAAGFSRAEDRSEPTDNERLWFEYPATDWCSQALHIGNGFMGGSFYGGVKEERFDITEKTMWTGGPGENPDYRYGIKPGGKDHVEEIRKAIVTGEVGKADRLVHEHFRGDYSNFGSFSMIGHLYFNFSDHEGVCTNYRRELDLSRSLAGVSYKMNGVRYEREYFCSYPGRIMVMRFTSDSPGKLGFTMGHELVHSRSDVTADGDELLVKGVIDGNNRAYRVRIKVLHDGGVLEAEGSEIKLSAADSATIIYAAATGYRLDPPTYEGANPDALTSAWIEAASRTPYEQLRQRHVKDYRQLYGRVELDLAGDPAQEKLPTNLRFENLENGNRNDTGLKVLLFNLGRYLLISASRPGTLPSTLQGVWNTYPKAPWNGNYQSNVNLQAMYWPCGPVNLPECQQAYVDWVKALVIPGREVAKAYYGTKGWVSHTTGNIWGYAAPGTGLIWGIYPVGAAWHCRHLWDQYAFSMDEKFLEEEAYPVMKEAAEFWLANLVPFEGYLISAPTVSAEHGVQEKDGVYIDPTVKAESRPSDGSVHRYTIPGAYQDIEMIHDLFTNVMEAAEELGIDRTFHDAIEKARAKLLPLKIGRHGQLQEWYADIDSPRDHHRHISHLWALFPGRMIHPLITPDLAEAAKISLNMRGDGRFEPMWVYSGGNWARTWRTWCWARLLDGDRADKIFTEMIREQGFENLMSFQHVPSRNNMQVDGSMSTPGFMAEMLLQSHLEELHLLPALPSQWSKGSVKGLIARGACKVDMEWDKGHLTRATVKALKGGVPRIRVEGEPIDPAKDPRVTIVEDQASPSRKSLKPGLHDVGFRLIEVRDRTRAFSTREAVDDSDQPAGRPVRIYVWYPARETEQQTLRVGDYVQMAADDFRSNGDEKTEEWDRRPLLLPVPLVKGLDEEQLDDLLQTRAAAVRDALPHTGSFPLLVLGQGLYYESPLTHILLCEYLAGHGYVVATCPLKGTHVRLVNLSVVDLETQIRDMELVLSSTRALLGVDPERLGIIGYDLGGMSGLTLSMRNPDVNAFLSMDSGILFGHFSELPQSHPHYNEERFLIPWMHMTQARFVPATGVKDAPPSLMDRKQYGDTYLLLADTASHGDFTSYAAFNIKKPVPGYWGPVTRDSRPLHEAICSHALAFFDAYLKGHEDAMARLQKDPEDLGLGAVFKEIRRKKGMPRPPYQDELVRLIIDDSPVRALAVIEEAAAAHPGRILIKEEVLNWLGYHFLYWWGREEESMQVFELNVRLFPRSPNAFDSLGEAYSVNGKLKKAIESYEKSLELNPENQNAKQALKRLRGSG